MGARHRRRAKIAQRSRAWVVVMRQLLTTKLPVASDSDHGPQRPGKIASALTHGLDPCRALSAAHQRVSRPSTNPFLFSPRQTGAGGWLGTRFPSPPRRLFHFYAENSHAKSVWDVCPPRPVALRPVQCAPRGLAWLRLVVSPGPAPRLKGVSVPPPSFPQAALSVAGFRSGLPTTRTDDVGPRALAPPRGKTTSDWTELNEVKTGGTAARGAFGENRTRRPAAVGTDEPYLWETRRPGGHHPFGLKQRRSQGWLGST